MWIVIIVILLVALFLVTRVPAKRQISEARPRGRFDFYLKGKNAGFSLSEIRILWSGIKHSNFEEPSRIFESIESLDALIGELTANKKFLERDGSENKTLALKNLLAYRRDIELNRMKRHLGLRSTRNIPVGQSLTIQVSRAGVYSSTVVENEDYYLTITIPVGDPLPTGFSWRRSKLNIYLWRKDDGGYFFQTRILEKFYDKRNLLFHLKHSDRVIRSQRRGFIRAPARIYGHIQLHEDFEVVGELTETSDERKCLITDISESGAALRTAGFVEKGKILKLKFIVRNETAVVTGMVKGIRYDKENNESILHIEFKPISENLTMLLLSYVLDINRMRSDTMRQDEFSMELNHGVDELGEKTTNPSKPEIENLASGEAEEQDDEIVLELEDI